jgi:hypothetical protein
MPHRRTTADPFADLARKIEILEREMATQREALTKLKEMSAPAAPAAVRAAPAAAPIRRTA